MRERKDIPKPFIFVDQLQDYKPPELSEASFFYHAEDSGRVTHWCVYLPSVTDTDNVQLQRLPHQVHQSTDPQSCCKLREPISPYPEGSSYPRELRGSYSRITRTPNMTMAFIYIPGSRANEESEKKDEVSEKKDE